MFRLDKALFGVHSIFCLTCTVTVHVGYAVLVTRNIADTESSRPEAELFGPSAEVKFSTANSRLIRLRFCLAVAADKKLGGDGG